MGFFGGFYGSRPGPGISKDAPPKKGIVLYFDLFFTHILKFVKENIMYAVTSLPMFFALYFSISIFDIFDIQKTIVSMDMAVNYERIKTAAVIVLVILLGSGPSSAAMAYMMRCITKSKHCFLLSDFKDKFKENFKNGIIISVLDIFVCTVFLPFALKYYFALYTESGSILSLILFAAMIIASLIYILAHNYFYQFIVTFDLGFLKAFKNSVIMAVGFLPLNILVVLIPIVCVTLLTMYFETLIILIFTLVFLIAFLRYPIEFAAARKINK